MTMLLAPRRRKARRGAGADAEGGHAGEQPPQAAAASRREPRGRRGRGQQRGGRRRARADARPARRAAAERPRAEPRATPSPTAVCFNKRRMPKMKTHSGAKKRFKKTGTGKLCARHAFTSHNLGKKSAKRKRHLGRPVVVSKADHAARQGAAAASEPRQALSSRAQEAPRHARADQGLPRARRTRATSGPRRPCSRPTPTPTAIAATRSATSAASGSCASTPPPARRACRYSQFMHGLKLAGDRARPQGARGHRRPRPRDVPTFCRESPGGRGRLSATADTQNLSRAPSEAPFLFAMITSPDNDKLKTIRKLQQKRWRDEARPVRGRGRGPGRGRRGGGLGAEFVLRVRRSTSSRSCSTP